MQTLSNPFQTLQIKWEVKFVVKEVYLRLPSWVFIRRRLFMRLSLLLSRYYTANEYITHVRTHIHIRTHTKLSNYIHANTVAAFKAGVALVIFYVFTQPLSLVGYYTRSIFKGDKMIWNQFYLSNAKEPSLSNNLPIAWRKRNRFISISWGLAHNETQVASSRVWTQVSVFISLDNK